MRWFGPADPVSLADIRQAGATGVVTALHEVPAGGVWTPEAIAERRAVIEAAGLRWDVVESVPVHDEVKRRTGDYRRYVDNYKACIRHLGAAGVPVLTYNFMPVCDWTRTDLAYAMPDGSLALRFDRVDFAAFDLYLLGRAGAEADYTAELRRAARERLDAMDEQRRARLVANVTAGLPGGTTPGADSLTGFGESLAAYDGIDEHALRDNLVAFVADIAPVAREAGVRLAIHPDDPPFPILGLPRVMSTADDARHLLGAVDEPANGLCFCTGSFGVRADNDLVAMAREFGDRTHFVHLRSTRREPDGSFYEADHLDGDVDVYGVLRELTAAAGRRGEPVPLRPDHGHQMLDDLGKRTNPGYSAIGRLRGLAELRGVMYALARGAGAPLALLATLLLAACGQQGEVETAYLAHGLPRSHPVHRGIEVFARALDSLSGGEMAIEIFPDGQLGNEREVLELLQLGSIPLTKVSAAAMANFAADYEVLGVPYLFRDADHLFRVLEGEVGERILDSGQDKLLRGLAFYDAGTRSFYTTERAVRRPEDLRGLKVRVMNHALSVDVVNALGASATPMSYGELYTALQQGVVDGAENNAPSYVGSGHYEVAKYYTLDEHTAMPDVLVVSTTYYDGLSAQQQAWLREAARLSVPAQRRFWAEAVAADLATARAAGVEIIEPEKEAFRAAAASVTEAFATTAERRAVVAEIRGM